MTRKEFLLLPLIPCLCFKKAAYPIDLANLTPENERMIIELLNDAQSQMIEDMWRQMLWNKERSRRTRFAKSITNIKLF